MSKYVEVIALIRNNKTGEVREHREDTCWYYDDPSGEIDPFMWSEGNYSCDCNRYLFFQRAKGEDDSDGECGDELYSVNLKDPKTGKIFYKEYEVG